MSFYFYISLRPKISYSIPQFQFKLFFMINIYLTKEATLAGFMSPDYSPIEKLFLCYAENDVVNSEILVTLFFHFIGENRLLFFF